MSNEDSPAMTLQDMMLRNAPMMGKADLYCMGPAELGRLAEQVAVLLGISDGEANLVDTVTVVLAPRQASDPDEAQLRAAVTAALTAASVPTDDPHFPGWLARALKVVSTSNLDQTSVLAAFPAPAAKQAVMVPYGARYRDAALQLDRPDGLGQPETIWSQHLARLAKSCVERARQTAIYVLVDAGEDFPFRPENQLRLNQIDDDCGVIGGGPEHSPEAVVAERAVAWLQAIQSGRVGDVITEIDRLAYSDLVKSRMKIQLLSQAGLHGAAVQLLNAELAGPSVLPPDVAIAYARVAHRAHDGDLVARLLRPAVASLEREEDLETAMRLAHEVGVADVVEACVQRMGGRFPQSTALLEYRLMERRRDGDYAAAAALLRDIADRADEANFYTWLATSLGSADVDYDAVYEAFDADWAAFADIGRVALAQHAERHDLLPLATNILISTGGDDRRTATEIKHLLHLASQRFLRRRSDDDEIEDDLSLVIQTTAWYLGVVPGDVTIRRSLARLVSVETSGSSGRLAAAHALFALASLKPEIRPTPPVVGPLPTEEDLRAVISAARAWIESEPVVSIGRLTFPPQLLPRDFKPRIASDLLEMVEVQGDTLVDDADERALKVTTAVAAALAPYTNEPNLDLTAMRLAAGKLVAAGRRQQARDLIEGVLELSGTDPARQRAAWFAYGDVYHRTGDLLEALLALSCGAARRVPVLAAEVWYEIQSLIRVFRDLGLSVLSRRLLGQASDMLTESGFAERYAHRLETVTLLLDFSDLGSHDDDPARLEALVERIADNCRVVLEKRDELGPVATLLVQAVRLARAQAVQTPAGVDDLMASAIDRLGGAIADQVRVFAADRPDAAALAQMAGRTENARFAGDAGFDMRNLAILARRFLNGAAVGAVQDVAFAIELLADQAVTRWDEIGDAEPVDLPSRPETPLRIARDIARTGLGVTLLGLDEQSRLVRVEVDEEAGETVQVEDERTFSIAAFRQWSRRYPYNYGFDRDEANAFLTSLRSVGVSSLPPRRAVMIMDTALQSLPANLIPVDGDFAARHRAIAMAPSLTWLAHAAARRDRAASPPRAWISTASAPEQMPTLGVMAERLQPTFDLHAIPLNQEPTIPADFAGAELAIVGAHGGLHLPDGRFFKGISDEDGLAEPSRALARALSDVKVVVLLVCSGGRVDAMPGAQTTMGLAKQLLNAGCSTVIGSPWPLSASVPVYWLPGFLAAWSVGAPVIDANAAGNAAVSERLGDTADVHFAMSVYGDPLVRKSPPRA
jgi:hypothetical protein